MDAVFLCSDQAHAALPAVLQGCGLVPYSRQLGQRGPDHLLLARLPADDPAMVRRFLAPADARAVLLTQAGSQDTQLAFRSLEAARRLAELLSHLAHDHGRLRLGLAELLINAVEHGNLAIGGNEKSVLCRIGLWEREVAERLEAPGRAERLVRLCLRLSPHELVFEIADEGLGFDWRPYGHGALSEDERLHGRGIALARALVFYRLEYLGCGNRVRAHFHEEADGAARWLSGPAAVLRDGG